MKRNLFFMYAISFFQGVVFYSSIATLYRQAAGLSVFQITLIGSISLALFCLWNPMGYLGGPYRLQTDDDHLQYSVFYIQNYLLEVAKLCRLPLGKSASCRNYLRSVRRRYKYPVFIMQRGQLTARFWNLFQSGNSRTFDFCCNLHDIYRRKLSDSRISDGH